MHVLRKLTDHLSTESSIGNLCSEEEEVEHWYLETLISIEDLTNKTITIDKVRSIVADTQDILMDEQ